MARAKSVLRVVCALLLAARASARPAIDAPAATHPDAHADSGCAAAKGALLGRHLSPGNFDTLSAGSSSLARRAATSKIVAGSVVGGIALATLLLAALFLWRRARRPAPAIAITVAGRSSDALGAAMDLPPAKLPALTGNSSSPTVHRIGSAMMTPPGLPTQTLRPVASIDSLRSPTLRPAASTGSLRTQTQSPVDLVARARRCSDWSHLPPPSRPGSPSSPRLRTVGSNGSLTFAPSAYQSTISLRPKASTSSLRAPPVAVALPALQPLIIPPMAAAPWESSSSTAMSSATSLKRQRSLASMLDLKSSGRDSPCVETPRAVVRYEADALISGCGARAVRYEVEEDAGTWTEEVVRLPPRYSTLQERPLLNASTSTSTGLQAYAPAASPAPAAASSPTMQTNV